MSWNSPFTVEINWSLFATALLCLLPLVLVIVMIHRRLKERRATRKSPFKELRRRPAGESLRIKIIALDEQIDDRIFLLLSMPAGAAFTVFMVKPQNLFRQ